MVTRFRRYSQIADILIKYGFGIFVRGLFPGFRRFRLRRQMMEEERSVYERVRLAIEELGPTFIKFGQIMSTRQEMLPPPLIAELKKLQDRVPPVPFEAIQSRLTAIYESGQFAEIEETPIASASLSQVHRAVMNDGTMVALKIQRPGIEEIIETDLAILLSMAERLERVFPDSRIYNPTGMVRDFSSQIRRELNFVSDGMSADRLSINMSGVPGIRIPKIFWVFSDRTLLVMDYIDGVRIDDVEAIREMGVDPDIIADRGFFAYMKQIFEDGFFHGDPHPGNLLVTRDGSLAFLDFGLFGVLRPERRYQFTHLIEAMVDKDPARMLKALEGLGLVIREQDRNDMQDELYLAMVESEGVNIGQYSFREMASGLTDSLRRYHLQVPVTMMLILKVIIMVLDVGIKLNPEFNFPKKTEEFFVQVSWKETLAGEFIFKATHSVSEAVDGIFDLPRNVNQTLRSLSTGTIKIDIVDTDIRRLQMALDKASETVVIGLIIAGLVVGSSFVLIATNITFPWWVSYFALIAFTAAAIIGFYSLYRVIIVKTWER